MFSVNSVEHQALCLSGMPFGSFSSWTCTVVEDPVDLLPLQNLLSPLEISTNYSLYIFHVTWDICLYFFVVHIELLLLLLSLFYFCVSCYIISRSALYLSAMMESGTKLIFNNRYYMRVLFELKIFFPQVTYPYYYYYYYPRTQNPYMHPLSDDRQGRWFGFSFCSGKQCNSVKEQSGKCHMLRVIWWWLFEKLGIIFWVYKTRICLKCGLGPILWYLYQQGSELRNS